jgi:signal transduction histidine kinase
MHVENTTLDNPDRLQALYRLCLLDTPADPAFDRLTQLASRTINAPISLVTLVDVDRQYYKSFVGVAEPWASRRQTPMNYSFCQHVVTSGDMLLVEDARVHPLVSDNAAVSELDVIAYAGIPLTTLDGYALGSFCVIDHKPRMWTPEELVILGHLAAAAMSEINLRDELIQRTQAQRSLELIQRELEQALEEAQQLNELRSRFMFMASHELRTPLSVVSMSSWIMYKLRSEQHDERSSLHFNRIKDAVAKMTELLDGVIDIGKTDGKSAPFHPTLTQLEPIIQCVIDSLTMTNVREQSVTFTVWGESCEVSVDKGLFESIVQNLIGNAVKYSPPNTTIEVHLSYEPSAVIFHVVDQGIGIPEEDQEKLFNMFYRAGNVGATQGTGLGLAITKRAVELHGGTISVSSKRGEGTTFTVNLPIP